MISLTMYNHESSRLIELHLENVPVSSKASCEKTQSDCCDRQCFFRWRIKPILSRKASAALRIGPSCNKSLEDKCDQTKEAQH